MRPFRLLFSLLTCLFMLTVLLYVRSPTSDTAAQSFDSPRKRNKISTLLSWSAPATLFPPSAIISLTDDNSTFFLARPGNFGPSLPSKGLSGQLWAGGTFADETFGRGGIIAGSEGELGCSDIPGWEESVIITGPGVLDTRKRDAKNLGDSRSNTLRYGARSDDTATLDVSDGTDDYLRTLRGGVGIGGSTTTSRNVPEHADIQSLQEEAEIEGKVVLLSRGGCGFLDKVKWAQRRGATALIVGDNVRGGPLITMYAHGDTSNVSIPALFTSHTTAHLLSSLMPTGPQTDRSKSQKTTRPQAPTTSPLNTPKEDISPDPRPSEPESSGWFSDILESLFPDDHGSDAPSKDLESSHLSNADFVIGVHDWRDSDGASDSESNARRLPNVHQADEYDPRRELPARGSIVPRSGEYGGAQQENHSPVSGHTKHALDQSEDDFEDYEAPHHEGLWVTLAPTSMSSSPFFDTLLVLVVSPLVTLTVVYSLLLLRSRIRRRRWRAPKSVVERLPVRTYHTISSDESSPTASFVSPINSTPTTPLLATAPRPVGRRSRPRARTTPEALASSSYGSPPQRDSSPETEKREAGLAEWRRKYGGRQKECVVCLEEYVDGVSRVMSLPCGHEFHAECITPWLTTRRRTCPICKGDVVRSLARHSHSSHPDDFDDDVIDMDSETDVQDAAASRRNDHPRSHLPILEEDLYDADLEAGDRPRWDDRRTARDRVDLANDEDDERESGDEEEGRRDEEGMGERIWRSLESLSESVASRAGWRWGGRREVLDRDR